MKHILLIFLITSISFAQTYIVKDQYGVDTGIRIEKEKSAYENGFEVGYGKSLKQYDYNIQDNVIIINNYNSQSDGEIRVGQRYYFPPVSKAKIQQKLNKANKKKYYNLQGPCWRVQMKNYNDIDRFFEDKIRCVNTPEFREWASKKKNRNKTFVVINQTSFKPKKPDYFKNNKVSENNKNEIELNSKKSALEVKKDLKFSESDLTDFVMRCNMDDFIYSYPQFNNKYKVLEINEGEIVRIMNGEIEFEFWQKVYFKDNVGYVNKSFFNSQEPISNYQ